MSSRRLLTRPTTLAVAASLFAVSAMIAGSAMATMGQPDDAAFKRYHQAIYAAAHCEGRNFYQDSAYNENWNGALAQAAQEAQAKMAEVIGKKTGRGLRAGNQLSLIDEAKQETRSLIAREGCQGSDVQTLLALFQSDLAPAL